MELRGNSKIVLICEAIVLCTFIINTILFAIVRSNSAIKSHVASQELYFGGEPEVVSRRLPGAIIIGARKCGTRALLKFLELNPAIKAASSEIHYFDDLNNYHRGLTWYRSQMPLSSSDQVTIEKSPAYFVTKKCPQRIKAMNESIKLIIILRNPVTRLISDFSQIVYNKMGWVGEDNYEYDNSYYSADRRRRRLDPGDEIAPQNGSKLWDEASQDFVRYVTRKDGGVNEMRRAIQAGMYSVHVERWRQHFAASQVHFVNGETLAKDPIVELVKVERFLGVEPKIKPEDLVFDDKKGFYCIASRRGPNCLGESKGRKHVHVKPELIEKLEAFYEPYNDYLFSMINMSFGGGLNRRV